MSDTDFQSFYSEVKHIEKKDSVYTSGQQISRLLRPGSTYANLNPFEVLLVEPEDGPEIIRKQYKRLSILLHPDKNPDDRERAQNAFDVLNKAYKCLESEQTRNKALEVVEEAKHMVQKEIDEKRKKLKKDRRDEKEDPIRFKQAVKVMTMKLFADYERKRRSLEERATEERKRKREEEIEAEEAKQVEKEWTKNFEDSRQNRVNSWQSFSKNTKSKRKDIRPPKHKAETR